ncbi:MAG: hypothetical protein KDD02_08725 [Phaeodactylibacter sp.]|nr:hypothetical protein [Phaeodactylibacter sp.]MCB9300179.1 hypothetical protein [Lewinellaceae bacterium]
MAGIIGFIKGLFTKKKKENVRARGLDNKADTGGFAYIDSPETYKFCFHDEAFIFVLGEQMEIEFAKEFIGLEDGNNRFHLDYTYETAQGPKEKTKRLVQEQQKVLFSMKSIFDDPEIPENELEKLKQSVVGPYPFSDIQLYVQNLGDGQKQHLRKIKGFVFPTDQQLIEQIQPTLAIAEEIMREEVGRIFYKDENDSRVFKGEAQLFEDVKSLFWGSPNQDNADFYEWIKAFRQVLLEEVRASMVQTYGYVFDDNLKDWLSRHTRIRV